MRIRKLFMLIVLFGLLGPGASSPTRADSLFHANAVTFKKPVRLPGVTLAAGSYLFETPDPKGRGLVSVFSEDRRHIFYTGLTIVVPRPASIPETQAVSFGESPQGVPPPVRVWWETGKEFGHQFYYPRNDQR
jgi:hypothetical protein